MLVARRIDKRYGPVRALTGVDIEVAHGEVVAVAGENGSGKSTLARILAGVDVPDAGSIELDGQRCSFSRPRDALERGIALVAQEPTAAPDLSIAENVLLMRLRSARSRFSRREAIREAAPLLADVGVDASPAAPFSSLGVGERVLVEVAKALAAKPRLLILDEATSRLPDADVERLFAIVRRLRGEGRSTIVITHRLREMRAIADRVIVLRDGLRVGALEREDITDDRVSTMMVGRDLGDFFGKQTVPLGDVVLRVDGMRIEGGATAASFDVRRGEILGLAGLVGSGRTELLETLGGLRHPLEGRVVVDGRELRTGSTARALAAGVALVPEDRHRQGLVLDASVRRNIAAGSWRALRRTRRGDELRTARRSMERLRIRALGAEAAASSLSGGNQQKVVVARCLTRRPKVLLLDEPTRGIDIGAKHELYELLGELLGEGLAIVLASSELSEILGLADRVLVLHDRCVVAELPREDATQERIALLSAGGDRRDRAA